MRIGIVTFHNANNYGAVLQCYALVEAIKELGHDVALIDLPLHQIPKNIRPRLRNKILSMAFSHFRQNVLPDSVEVTEEKEVYIFGSDQIWNPQITKKYCLLYFGSWVKANIPKIAYAASFGLSTWGYPEYKKEVANQLVSFTAIGVRESSGLEICQDTFNVSCKKVVDPVLLRNNYSDLFTKRNISNSLVCYILCKGELLSQKLRDISEKCNLKPILLNDFRIRSKIKSVAFPSVSTWLSYIEASQFVLTDSFHCMVFAILFKKKFIAIPATLERSGRMLSLLEDLGLESRFINDINEVHQSDIIFQDIDYSKVEQKINILRASSLSFLKDSLDNVSCK